MAVNDSSPGWFKKAEEIEQERKSGSIPPPQLRRPVPPRPSDPDVAVPKPPSQVIPAPSTRVTIPDVDVPKPLSRTLTAPPPRVPVPDPIELTPAPVAAPKGGTFSLIPDGAGHRLVFARSPDLVRTERVTMAGLSVAELRQLKAAVERYLGAVDPAPPAGGA
jgi:hypothetical protein